MTEMKKWMLGMGAMLLLAGCSSDEDVQQNITKGLEAVADDNFGKAEALFEVALEEGPKNEQAKAYLQQVVYMQEARDVDTEAAIDMLQQAMDVENGSNVIRAKAEEQQQALVAAATQQETMEQAIAEAKAFAEDGAYTEANAALDRLTPSDLAAFPELQQQVASLKEANAVALQQQAEQIAKEEAAKAEAAKAEAAKQQAAKEAAEKAAKQAADPYAWAPGIKQAFEDQIVNEGFVDSYHNIRYEQAGVDNNEGYLQVYTELDGQEYRVVRVNVKTGDFSGL